MLRDGTIDGENAWCGAGSQDDRARRSDNADPAARCEQLHRRLKRIANTRAALDAQEIATLREASDQRIWRTFGCASLGEYMERELGYTPRAAAERLRVAQVMEEVPQLEQALAQGNLSFSATRELARVATPETATAWIAATEGKNVRQIEELVSGHQRGDRPTDRPDPSLRRKVLRFEVKPETYALMRQVEKVLEAERGERLDHDAVINALCRAILDGSADRETAAYQVAVTVCPDCNRGWQDGGGLTVEMTPPAVERARCDAQEIGSIDGDQVERAKQTVPPAVRRKVKRRDHGRCRVPGCRSTRNLDIHHLVPRAQNGGNELRNLLTLCEGHHLAHHAGSLVITGALPDLVFTRAPKHDFKLATRAVETASALRTLGFKAHEIAAAVAAAKTHVGREDLPIQEWIRIALRNCPRPS